MGASTRMGEEGRGDPDPKDLEIRWQPDFEIKTLLDIPNIVDMQA